MSEGGPCQVVTVRLWQPSSGKGFTALKQKIRDHLIAALRGHHFVAAIGDPLQDRIAPLRRIGHAPLAEPALRQAAPRIR